MPALYNNYVLITGEADNSQLFPVQQVTYNKRVSDVNMMFPFGIYANVQTTKSYGILLPIKGQEDNNACIAANTPELRPRDLDGGEIAYYHPATGTAIKLRKNGDLEITTESAEGSTTQGNVIINCENATINATTSITFDTPLATFTTDVKINGDITVNGSTTLGATVTSNGKDISDTHTHKGSATAPTGAISPTGTPN